MIQQLVNKFQRFDRDIEALTYVIVVFLLILAIRAAMLIYEHQYGQLWPLLAPTTPLLAALLIVRVANRLIVNGNIIREDDRRQEIVRTTHHLIAIAKDLRARVGYVKTTLAEGGRPALVLFEIATTIEERYETLLNREAYKFLPGKCVDIITQMSGDIFGIGLLAAKVKHIATANPAFALKDLSNMNSHIPVAKLDELMTNLQELIDELFKLRTSLDVEPQNS